MSQNTNNSRRCLICLKNSNVRTGWHTKNGLNFCSNQHVVVYLESLCDTVWKIDAKKLNKLRGKRIKRLANEIQKGESV